MLGFLGFLVPKVHWGRKNMRKRFQKFGNAFDNLAKGVTEATLSNLLPSKQAVLNLATRWRSSTPDSCKTLLVLTWTKAFRSF